ncbi:HNH endonuclease [Marinobacter confluentis]|uniref:HNH endonuclease n=1 Tax=Marinobacter confluentis TaxID=1697557 RepID=A0A4Z1BRC3_9GAMM|nr:HNH endonuclease [Marinobacter confluentis]TGN39799.1 hypothetical protein E5Q11_05700 [Marinobacter confluentis]
MRSLSLPHYSALDVYKICIKGVSNPTLRLKLASISSAIETSEYEYKAKAKIDSLYQVPANEFPNSSIVYGQVTKEELKKVYNQYLVGPGKPARAIYDALRHNAPNGRCPFCGHGHVATLDHYLPKSKFPQYCVAPVNLVPSCRDCNSGKSTAHATLQEKQTLHPYFLNPRFVDEQWIFAEVKETTPPSVSYFVRVPADWNDVMAAQASRHFDDFGLGDRYALEASHHLGNLRESLKLHLPDGNARAIKRHLEKEAEAYNLQHKNSWQTAMLQALADNEWYCNGGYE